MYVCVCLDVYVCAWMYMYTYVYVYVHVYVYIMYMYVMCTLITLPMNILFSLIQHRLQYIYILLFIYTLVI